MREDVVRAGERGVARDVPRKDPLRGQRPDGAVRRGQGRGQPRLALCARPRGVVTVPAALELDHPDGARGRCERDPEREGGAVVAARLGPAGRVALRGLDHFGASGIPKRAGRNVPRRAVAFAGGRPRAPAGTQRGAGDRVGVVAHWRAAASPRDKRDPEHLRLEAHAVSPCSLALRCRRSLPGPAAPSFPRRRDHASSGRAPPYLFWRRIGGNPLSGPGPWLEPTPSPPCPTGPSGDFGCPSARGFGSPAGAIGRPRQRAPAG